jgi:hypothetical protein
MDINEKFDLSQEKVRELLQRIKDLEADTFNTVILFLEALDEKMIPITELIRDIKRLRDAKPKEGKV